MKEKLTGKTSGKAGSNWERLRILSDRQIWRGIEADPDAKSTDADFWKNARVVMPKAKKTIA